MTACGRYPPSRIQSEDFQLRKNNTKDFGKKPNGPMFMMITETNAALGLLYTFVLNHIGVCVDGNFTFIISERSAQQ